MKRVVVVVVVCDLKRVTTVYTVHTCTSFIVVVVVCDLKRVNTVYTVHTCTSFIDVVCDWTNGQKR